MNLFEAGALGNLTLAGKKAPTLNMLQSLRQADMNKRGTFRTPTSPTRPATTFCLRGVSGLHSLRVRELHLDVPQGAVLSRLLSCAHFFDTAREAVRAAIGRGWGYNPPRHPVVGCMRSAMARLIAGVDMAGHFMGAPCSAGTHNAPRSPEASLSPFSHRPGCSWMQSQGR